MKGKRKQLSVVSVLTLGFVLLASVVPVFPQEGGPSTVAEASIEATRIAWQPFVDYGGAVLTYVRPDDQIVNIEFGADQRPALSLVDAAGNPLPDGVYKYELLILSPSMVAPPADLDAEQRGLTSWEGASEPTIQSGAFSVLNGAFVTQDVPEDGDVGSGNQLDGSPSIDDFVINDDLIVDGSACIGFDCVNGESFGFDTLRLKENNLRIKFDDTSTAASFPRNDWQITANDSTNGGASKFSIDDISGNRTPFTIEANARSHSLYIDDGGRLGLRTSTPAVEIHTIDGDTPTLRLQQDGSSGFAPQTWDVAGNETNFFIRDVTNGSQLPFRIRPDAPTNSIFVDVDGDIGLGTSSPDTPLEVFGNTNVALKMVNTAGGVSFQLDPEDNGSFWNVTAQAGAGDFVVNNNDGAGSIEFTLTGAGDLTIEGDYFSATCTSPGSPCAPDYVFEDDYVLLSLAELEAFIKQNKHLPNVPSEDDLRAAGVINNSEFQMILLEKIEELTLYTLQQQQIIEELKARIEALESTQ